MKKHLLFLCLISFIFLNFEKPLPSKSTRKGKDYALFFAVNKYQSPKLTTLQNPIGDANRIAQELQSSYGFQTEVVENPTYELIEQKLQEYNRNFNIGKYDKDGQLLIFFSGHGARQLTNGYFLPSDVNPDDLKRSAFNYKIWRDDMDAIDCKHILVAIDACYSGSFDPKFGMKTDGLFGTRAGELTEGQRLIAEHEKHKTRLFFTSGESDQPTPDKSDFAKKFLASLLTKGYDDGVLTSSEMFSNYLEKAAPRPLTGEFGGDEAGSSFVFIVENEKNTGGVSTHILEIEAWANAKQKNLIAVYEIFLSQFPNSEFMGLAKTEIQRLHYKEEYSAWQLIQNSNEISEFEKFKRDYPQSLFLPFVEKKINKYASTNNIETLKSSEGIEFAVDEICKAIGIKRNIIVKKSNQVTNVIAITENSKRYILYNENFFDKTMTDSKTFWSIYLMLAHEIGHHVNYHDLTWRDYEKW